MTESSYSILIQIKRHDLSINTVPWFTSVITETRLWAEWLRNQGLNRNRSKTFLPSPQHPDHLWVHQVSYIICTKSSFPRVRAWLGHEANHPCTSNAEVTNSWSFTSTTWCLIKQKSNFTFYFVHICRSESFCNDLFQSCSVGCTAYFPCT